MTETECWVWENNLDLPVYYGVEINEFINVITGKTENHISFEDAKEKQ